MGRPYSEDLRRRAVDACSVLKREEVVELFNVGIATLSRWLRRQREQGTVAPSQMGGPRNVLIDDAGLDVIREIVRDDADILLEELAVAYGRRTGTEVSRATIGRAVKRAGITRKKKPSRPRKLTPHGLSTPACSG